MTVNVTFDLPAELEAKLLQGSPDLAAEVKEAFAVELYRKGVLDHYDLSRFLNIDRYETDALLVRHNVFEGGLTLEDVREDVHNLQEFLAKAK